MAEISAKAVAELRKQTGCGMMDCKNALKDANGDFEAAVKLLREKGMAATAKKADRIAAEGLVDIMTIGNVTAMVEVNSETDFVAKNAVFQEFVKNILKTIIANRPANVEELLASTYVDGDVTVEAKLKEMIFVIGEKITVRRFAVVEGCTSTYIHGAGSIGVVVSFDADAAVVATDAFAEFAKNIALQIGAFTTPYLDRDSVPAKVIEDEKAIILAQMANDPKNAGKPENILEKMVIGKLGKFYENNCLLDMEYFKDDDMKVGKYVEKTAKELGGDIKITGFFRFEKGEGIEKKEEDFAAEIAKLAGGN